jgi:hypothetical protein
MSSSRDVRFPPESDRIADVPDWLLRADIVAKVENRTTQKISLKRDE